MASKIEMTAEKDVFDAFKESLKKNDGYCPCRLEKKPEYKCMCKEFREMKSGTCHCGIYTKTEITDEKK